MAWLALWAPLGCEDIDWDWEMQEWRRPQRPIRPSRRQAPENYDPRRPEVRVGSPPTRPPGEPAEKPSAQPADRPPQTATPVSEQPAGPKSYHKLYLVSGDRKVEPSAHSRKFDLKRARSAPAVNVLGMLYPSIGASGSPGQRFLVYQHGPMWSAAAEFAPLLDCPERTNVPPTDPAGANEAFELALGMVYRLAEPGQPTDFEGLKRCVRLLQQVYTTQGVSGQLQWGAAVLAGRVQADLLSEYAPAQSSFERAKGFALPGSVEEMIAVYGIAETSLRAGRQERGLMLAKSLLEQFARHRPSRVYELAAEMVRNKKAP